MIALTGATGQLGHYVLQDLLNTVPASQIVAIVRNPAKAQALSQQGVVVRQADYSDEAALTAALQGVDKLLLISSSEVGQRAVQHRNVINAAKAAGVKFIAYTSLLHADTSPLGLAAEHIETEQMLADSGIAYALLRNGWYTENYLASAPPALEHGVFIGAAGEGKIASATRADYAARRWVWPQSISKPSRCWPTLVSLTPCCVTAGIPKTIWPARRRRWSMACLSAPPARVKSPPPPAPIMPPLP
ncbi:NAD(P)H-binding protein, partial [Klebsiella pneumoniae]|nr:NAD(P)H-binding protein [Klebsiella pneumoniae]